MLKKSLHKSVKEYGLILLGATLVGLAYNMFLLPSKLAAGGLSGVSTILYEVYQWGPAMTQVVMNIPIIVLGWLTIGKEFGGKTILGTFWVPFIIWLSANVPYTIANPILGALYGGIILGVGLGIVYKGGGSTGGTAAIAQIVKKFTGLSSGYSQLIVDGLVVSASLVVFNLELTLFALVAIYISSKAIDVVQLRTSATKLIVIITKNEMHIETLIKDGIDRGLTKVKSVGGYTNQNQTMILCVAEKQEAIYLKNVLQEKEPDTFVIFLDASEILGRGFSLDKYYGQKL